MHIGFDFDGTIFKAPHFESFISLISPILNQNHTFVLTTRDKITAQVKKQTKKLGLNTHSRNMIAIGDQLSTRLVDSKAHFIHTMGIKCDLFFDNDPYEIEDFRKFGIPAIWIPEMDKESLMWEITEGFFKEKRDGSS